MARSSTEEELDLSGLSAGRVFLPGEAASASDVPLQMRLIPAEVRALVHGARLLGVTVSHLVSWAGAVNPDETALPRWQRPFVDDGQLVRLCLLLDPGSLRVSSVLAERFDVEVETYLVARTFEWLRRIRARNLEDKRWERLAVPVPRTGWRMQTGNRSGLRLA
jgi:hypothetical protein